MMSAPDFQASRRALRELRISDALGEPRTLDASSHRDKLLELLLQMASVESRDFSSLREDQVDIVVSIALSELAERPEDALGVVLLCIEVLAADGQFARLRQLVRRIHALSNDLEYGRPILALAVRALAEVIRGDKSHSQRLLASALGVRGNTPELVSRDSETVKDLVCASALMGWLATDSQDKIESAGDLAIRSGDGLMYSYLAASHAYARAAHSADVTTVLTESDETFRTARLTNYLRRLANTTLFPAQIEAIRSGATLEGDRVVALPTSSGKTFIAQLRIAATLTRWQNAKVIYLAPYRLLSNQVERELSSGLRFLNLQVRDMGSGFDTSVDARGLGSLDADVIVCTPERLDALVRLSSSNRHGSEALRGFFEACRLLVFDELHLVGRPGRGPQFELLLTRLRLRYPHWRILGLCAASHGADELAAWLTGQPPLQEGKRPTGTIEIAWETSGRLVQRIGNVRGVVGHLPRGKQSLEDAAKLVLKLVGAYRPVLIVLPTRPNAESVASKLHLLDPSQGARWREQLVPSARVELDRIVEEVRLLLGAGHKLVEQLTHGIAYHHAGVPDHLLRGIESLARRRLLRVLCSTTTVAEGADLPFRAVVLPHLNFAGSSRRLERDLYLNIIGRAGRANVSMEGLVFILESDASTLRDLVPRSLWATTQADRVRSRVPETSSMPMSLEAWEVFTDVKAQLLGWLGEGGGGVDNQAVVLASHTLSAQSADPRERGTTARLFSDALESLQAEGLAVAASPYRLTELGELSRLAGLSGASTHRLQGALSRQGGGWLADLEGVDHLTDPECELMAALLFESFEVLKEGLWLRRAASTEASRWSVLQELMSILRPWPYSDPTYRMDVRLLAGWLQGKGYEALGQDAPVYDRANSLFGGTDSNKRASDAAEYVGRLIYPAAWTWSAIGVMLGSQSDILPSFVRRAIENGLPSEAACFLADSVGLTRPSAMLVSRVAGTSEDDVVEWIASTNRVALTRLGIASVDMGRIEEYAGLAGS